MRNGVRTPERRNACRTVAGPPADSHPAVRTPQVRHVGPPAPVQSPRDPRLLQPQQSRPPPVRTHLLANHAETTGQSCCRHHPAAPAEEVTTETVAAGQSAPCTCPETTPCPPLSSPPSPRRQDFVERKPRRAAYSQKQRSPMSPREPQGNRPALRVNTPHGSTFVDSRQLAQDFRKNLALAAKTASVGSSLIRRRLGLSPPPPTSAAESQLLWRRFCG